MWMIQGQRKKWIKGRGRGIGYGWGYTLIPWNWFEFIAENVQIIWWACFVLFSHSTNDYTHEYWSQWFKYVYAFYNGWQCSLQWRIQWSFHGMLINLRCRNLLLRGMQTNIGKSAVWNWHNHWIDFIIFDFFFSKNERFLHQSIQYPT